MIREALLYEKLDGGKVHCNLCAHRCRINPGRSGICGVRENREGVLYSLVYGTLIAENLDPIEKKPFFHVYPASQSYSIATVGCNFRCDFCQNHDISQMPAATRMIAGEDFLPREIVTKAKQSRARTIAYTYTEPTVYFELALDTATIAVENGLQNVFVTNGFMTVETIEKIAPYLTAANVDLKSFRDEFYNKYCGARLNPVLESLQTMKKKGIWVEITTLLIPGLNDSDEELKDIARFIAGLGRETPWHISRFHPQYKMRNRPVTPLDALHRVVQIGRETGLKYVYSGNVPGDDGENTRCFHCGKLLIERYGFRVGSMNLQGKKCSHCGTELEGVFTETHV
ncbi:MAG TPA: AmmeMemoRadiSam system radical SAM enzyme [Smithella sp.]|nr:AmmeMemoRadiSam system radical SAM enzyme [Smithella sp.]HOU50143.1 AmmeMemoRadiSam system radical SAM enzyme [Smithella sp.]HQG64726.1 AmmeMemoRadiSam system radical SAM enzyme [Smithella sp.]HQH17136.1 AmmeMemoRadiSam system radical SAM enzyme [Smithella sp.]HQI72343.1 AmmeMemoRadiSam system radical SAM enzyme [Smithella sp.]